MDNKMSLSPAFAGQKSKKKPADMVSRRSVAFSLPDPVYASQEKKEKKRSNNFF
jgi:hypothetical protein